MKDELLRNGDLEEMNPRGAEEAAEPDPFLGGVSLLHAGR
jgi:hypothetical protein